MEFFLYLIEVSSTSLPLKIPKPKKPQKTQTSKKLTKPKPTNQKPANQTNKHQPQIQTKINKQPYQNQTGLDLGFQRGFFSLW